MATYAWRAGLWYFGGRVKYTKVGYAEAEKSFSPSSLNVDLRGKVYVVTGANQGIGKAIASGLAKRGGRVLMLCRNRERGETAKTAIANEIAAEDNSNSASDPAIAAKQLEVHVVDMSDFQSINAFVKHFRSEGSLLHGLVNNAGCMLVR